jgi:DNA modification methylase
MAISQMGDLFQLGRHRLLCGDATNEKDMKVLLNGVEVDLILTDPPYGVGLARNRNSGKGGRLKFKRHLLSGIIEIVPTGVYKPMVGDDKPFNPEHLLRMGKNQIIFGANYFASKLPERSGWIVWDKTEGVLRNNFADCELAWTSFNKPARIYRHLWIGLLRKGERKDELRRRVHPTQKPVGLFTQILEEYSEEGDIILDPYLGSGTTLIACEKTGRVCYGMEIEPEYCDLIIKRFAEYRGIPEHKIRETGQEIKGGDDGNI